MGFLFRRQKGVYTFTGIARLSIISFLIALSYAFTDTIWAVYLSSIFSSLSIISFVSAFLTIIAFLSLFVFIPLIEKNNKSRLFMLSLFFIGISYILFLLENIFVFFIAAILFTIFSGLRINSFGIIIRDKSAKNQLSRNEGLIYTFFNVAWLIGPLLAGFVFQAFGIPVVFIISAIFVFLGLFLFKISKINDGNIVKKSRPILKDFREFFKSRNRTLIYIIGGGVNFWFILIYLYMPLYILQQGLQEIWIGYFLFAISIPTVLLELFFGKLAGKIGFKRIFIAGYTILALASLACFIIGSIYSVMGVLVIASIGIAMLEPTTEAYFFHTLKKKKDESRFYSFYNTTIDVNHFIGKFLAGIFLLFLPLRFIFLFFSFFMIIYFFLSFRLREIIEHK
jgi:MFS family permease